jgi:hypothetical protein
MRLVQYARLVKESAMQRTASLKAPHQRFAKAPVTRPIPIRAAPPRAAPLRSPGCACGGGCPACQAQSIAGPDHPAERAADQVAARVMAMPDAAAVPRTEDSAVMRQPEEDEEEESLQMQTEEEEEELLQMQAEDEEEEEALQLQTEDEDDAMSLQARAEAGTAAASVGNPMSGLGSGRPLPPPALAFFEPRFGRSFANVRIHDDAAAQRRARAIRAKAFTYGRNIVFSSGRYSPDTGAGRHLLAHELTHVVQQGQGPARTQCAPADFEVTGKQSEVKDRDDVLYFEKGSHVVDPDEASKLPDIIANEGKDLIIKGYRSRDESSSLAGKRARAVEDLITARDPAVKTLVKAQKTSYLRVPFYRALRAVKPEKNTAASAAPVCPKGAEKIKSACPDTVVDVAAMWGEASTDLMIARKFVEHHKAKTLELPGTAEKLRRFFRPGFDMDRIISDLEKIEAQVDTVAARDMGKADNRPGYRCATNCADDCVDARAVSKGAGPDNRITLCEVIWNEPESAASITTLIHEASHGTLGVGQGAGGTDDVVYEREKVITYLTNAEALQSADIFANFVQELVHGGPETILPTTTDDVSGFTDAGQRDLVGEALARMAKWLQASSSAVRDVHAEAISAKSSGWGSSWARDYMEQLHDQFGLTAPRAKPKEKDVRAVAGIADRLTLLSGLVNGNSIRAFPSPLPTTWHATGSPAPSLLPGTEVELDPDAFAIFGLADGIRDLLAALLWAAPTVPSAMVSNYVELIDWVRQRRNIGP